MPFRDEKEAAAARIEALEAELREERAKNAELEKRLEGKVDAPREEPPPSTSTPPRRGMSVWTKIAIGMLGVAVAIGGCHVYEQWYDLRAHGELKHVHLAEFADGRPALVVTDRVDHESDTGTNWHERLDVVDPLQGRRTARVMAPGLRDCVPAAHGFVWCLFDHALEQREIAGLHVARTNADLVAVVPALAKGLHESPSFDPREHEIYVLTNDGQRHRFAADGTHAALVSTAPREPLVTIDSDFHPARSCDRHVGDAILSLQKRGTPRAQLARTMGNGEPTFLGNDEFLDADLVCDDTRDALAGIDRGIVLVAHTTSLDARDVQLSAVGLDGKVRWTTQLGKGKLHAAWTFGDGRVVVAIEEQGLIAALRLDDGQVVWSVET